MSNIIRILRIGATTSQVVVAKWLVAVGDEVEPGTELALLEADKDQIVLESEFSGALKEQVLAAGAEAEAGDVLGGVGSVRRARSRVFASPLARRLARETGIDVSRIRGTGPAGRVCRRDVEAVAAADLEWSPFVLRRSVSLPSAVNSYALVQEAVATQDAGSEGNAGLHQVRVMDKRDSNDWCPADPLPAPSSYRLPRSERAQLYIGLPKPQVRSSDVRDEQQRRVTTLALVVDLATTSPEAARAWLSVVTDHLRTDPA